MTKKLPPVMIEAFKKSVEALRYKSLKTSDEWTKYLKEKPEFVDSPVSNDVFRMIEEDSMYADIIEGFLKRLEEKSTND